MPDLNHVVKTRRNNLKKKWTGKEWKEKREAFIKKNGGKCCWCGGTAYLTVHHPMRNGYGDTVYMDFYLSGCILLCRSCHTALHVGKVLCDRVHEDKENHYKWHDADMCGYCFIKEHPEIKEKKKADKETRRKATNTNNKKKYNLVKQYKIWLKNEQKKPNQKLLSYKEWETMMKTNGCKK